MKRFLAILYAALFVVLTGMSAHAQSYTPAILSDLPKRSGNRTGYHRPRRPRVATEQLRAVWISADAQQRAVGGLSPRQHEVDPLG